MEMLLTLGALGFGALVLWGMMSGDDGDRKRKKFDAQATDDLFDGAIGGTSTGRGRQSTRERMSTLSRTA